MMGRALVTCWLLLSLLARRESSLRKRSSLPFSRVKSKVSWVVMLMLVSLKLRSTPHEPLSDGQNDYTTPRRRYCCMSKRICWLTMWYVECILVDPVID